jgi:hypothetical protein
MSVIEWLNVGLGIVFIYLIVALTCTAVTEGISSVLGLRWRMLEDRIRRLLNDGNLLDRFYQSPIVKALFDGKRKPSAIPAQAFSAFVFEQVFPETRPDVLVKAQDVVQKAQIAERSKSSLLAVLSSAEGKLDGFRANVEKWFDTTMQSVSAWYKGRSRLISLIVAVVVVGAANIDTIAVGKFLSTNAEARKAIADMAAEQAAADSSTLKPEAARLLTLKREYSLPLGWSGLTPERTVGWWLQKLFGLLLTASAASLGAPFWFDLLAKLADVRKKLTPGNDAAGAAGAGGSKA